MNDKNWPSPARPLYIYFEDAHFIFPRWLFFDLLFLWPSRPVLDSWCQKPSSSNRQFDVSLSDKKKNKKKKKKNPIVYRKYREFPSDYYHGNNRPNESFNIFLLSIFFSLEESFRLFSFFSIHQLICPFRPGFWLLPSAVKCWCARTYIFIDIYFSPSQSPYC